MSDSDDDILKEARHRFRTVTTFEADNREKAVEDLEFLDGDQWPEQIKAQREEDGRPCLTINRLPTFLDQVVGDQRQTRPSIRVTAVDMEPGEKVRNADGTRDYNLAQVYEGIIRHIERLSHAERAYDEAFEQAASCGFGYFRVNLQYVADDVFEQDLAIQRIFNQFTVYMDPRAVTRGPEHARWCFVSELVPMEEFKERYPEADHSELGQGTGEEYDGWYEDGGVRIAEYWRLEEEPDTLLLMSDGTVVSLARVSGILDELAARGITVVRERRVRRPRMRFYRINANEILEEPVDWPGRYIPIVPVYGKLLNRNGKPVLRGLVRHAKDPQRMYNYWRTAATEAVALAPKAPFVAAVEQIEEFKKLWQNANRQNLSVLPYRATQGIQAPQRVTPPSPPSGMVTESQLANDDMKGTTGIFDASLGARGNETSGKAILARQQEGDVATFAFHDNLAHALVYAGKVLVDLIPKVYDTERVVRIINADGAEDYIRVNKTVLDEQTGERVVVADLSRGRYDVSVSTGPSVTTQRAQAAEAMLEFVRAMPAAGPVVGDLLARNMDWPGADELADRLRKLVPEQILQREDEQDEKPEITPEDVQAAVQDALQQAGVEIERIKSMAQLLEAKADMAQAIEKAQLTEETVRQMIEGAIAELLNVLQSPQGAIQSSQDAGGIHAT